MKRSSVFMTQVDNQCPILENDLNRVIRIHALFFRQLVLPDVPLLNNPKMFSFFKKEGEWLKANFLTIALRDKYFDEKIGSMVGLFDRVQEANVYDGYRNIEYAEMLDKLRKTPIDLSRLSEHYTNRIDAALSNIDILSEFGLSDDALVKALHKALLNELNQKGYVTRSTIYEVGDKSPKFQRNLRKLGDAYYWEGIPATLSISASIPRMKWHTTDLISKSLNSYLAEAVAHEIKELEFPASEQFFSLTLDDINTIRQLPSFTRLNRILDRILQEPREDQLKDLSGAFSIHVENISGYMASQSRLDSKHMVALKARIHRAFPLKWYNLITAGISLIPNLQWAAIPSFIAGLFIIKDPVQELRENRAYYIRKVLCSSPDEEHISSLVSGFVDNNPPEGDI